MPKKNNDIGSILKWSIIGFILMIVIKLVFSPAGKGGSYTSFWDYLKNLFNWGNGTGSDGSGSAGSTGSGGSSAGGSASSVNSSYAGLDEGKHFKLKEYFKKNVYPSDPMHKANYNRLLKVLDRVRNEWGSQIYIVKGYEPNSDIQSFRDCTAVRVMPMNGKIEQLYDLVSALKTSGSIQPVYIANLNVDGYKSLTIKLQ